MIIAVYLLYHFVQPVRGNLVKKKILEERSEIHNPLHFQDEGLSDGVTEQLEVLSDDSKSSCAKKGLVSYTVLVKVRF